MVVGGEGRDTRSVIRRCEKAEGREEKGKYQSGYRDGAVNGKRKSELKTKGGGALCASGAQHEDSEKASLRDNIFFIWLLFFHHSLLLLGPSWSRTILMWSSQKGRGTKCMGCPVVLSFYPPPYDFPMQKL